MGIFSSILEMSDEYLDKEFHFDNAIRNPYAKEISQQIINKLPKYPFEVSQTEVDGHVFWIAKSTHLKGCVGQGDEKSDAVSELAENEEAWLETADKIDLDITI